jgi:hypothetical protein
MYSIKDCLIVCYITAHQLLHVEVKLQIMVEAMEIMVVGGSLECRSRAALTPEFAEMGECKWLAQQKIVSEPSYRETTWMKHGPGHANAFR